MVHTENIARPNSQQFYAISSVHGVQNIGSLRQEQVKKHLSDGQAEGLGILPGGIQKATGNIRREKTGGQGVNIKEMVLRLNDVMKVERGNKAMGKNRRKSKERHAKG